MKLLKYKFDISLSLNAYNVIKLMSPTLPGNCRETVLPALYYWQQAVGVPHLEYYLWDDNLTMSVLQWYFGGFWVSDVFIHNHIQIWNKTKIRKEEHSLNSNAILELLFISNLLSVCWPDEGRS
jgi:hypothetical protein